MEAQELGARVRAARERSGLTQAQLADAVDLANSSAVSRMESGTRKISSYELARIADALRTSPNALLATKPREKLALAARLAADAITPQLSPAADRACLLLELEQLLDQCGVVNARPIHIPEIDLPRTSHSVDAGERLAAQLRTTLSLGEHPIGDIAELIEDRLGILVDQSPLPDGLSGLCAQGEHAALMLVNRGDVRGRRRFTTAHELAHLLFADAEPFVADFSNYATDQLPIEMRANAFAAAFLMPGAGVDAFVSERGSTDDGVIALAFHYGVSLAALAWRLANLRLIDPPRRDELLMPGTMGRLAYAHGYRESLREEMAERAVTVVPPKQTYDRALEAYRMGQIGIGPLASLLQATDAEALRAEFESKGVVPDYGTDFALDELV